MTMMNLRRLLGGVAAAVILASGLVPSVASAQTMFGPPRAKVTVTITNLAPSDGTLLTPFWVALHNGRFDTYDRLAPASAALESLAEDGDTGPLSDVFLQSGRGQQATLVGSSGPLDAGDTATHTFIVNPNAGRTRFFSYASMVIPSNDAFVANSNQRAHRLFNRDGEFVGQDFTILGSRVLDAGTEVNDEEPANTAALAQAAPNTGVDEGGVIRPHAGFMAGGNILAARPAADFTEPDYELARVEFSVEDIPSTFARTRLRGSNQVPPITSDVVGHSVARLTNRGNLRVRLTVPPTSGVTAAHIHSGAPGENGPVVAFLFTDGTGAQGPLQIGTSITAGDLVGPLEGGSVADLWELIEAGGAYVNVHTIDNPPGEVRGTLLPR